MWIDDSVLALCAEPIALRCFIPESPLLVLGRGNDAELECLLSACEADAVPILRRQGGGGAVVLHPGCVIVSLGAWVSDYYEHQRYFDQINLALIASLAERWPAFAGLSLKGISDIAWGEKKVAGTSLFRSRNYLLYQASLLIDTGLPLIERYLAHPSREPAYRAAKSHGAFLTALGEIEKDLSAAQVQEQFTQRLKSILTQQLSPWLLPTPDPSQVEYLLARLKT